MNGKPTIVSYSVSELTAMRDTEKDHQAYIDAPEAESL